MGPLSRILLILVIMILLAQPLFIIPMGAQKSSPGISFDDIAPSEYNFIIPTTTAITAKFYTNVSVWDPDGRTINVELGAALIPKLGWSYMFTPSCMTVNSTGTTAVVLTVIVPAGVKQLSEVQFHISALGTYPNDTMVAYTFARIWFAPKYSLEWSHYFTNRAQYENRVMFNITNRGSDQDQAHIGVMNSIGYHNPPPDDFSFASEPGAVLIMPNETGTIELSIRYSGSSFPKELVVWVRLISEHAVLHGQSSLHWDTNITVTYVAPDRTKQNYIFAGIMSAAIIIMIVVMVTIISKSGKKK